MDEITGFAIMAIFPLCMIFATIYDVLTMTIPNKISLALVASYVVLAPLSGLGLETIAWSVALSLFVLFVGFGLFSMGKMGGGDAKLMAASALWFGTAFTLPYLIVASLMGGVLTIIIWKIRRLPLPLWFRRYEWIERLHDNKQGVPYGAALGPAALLLFANTHWVAFATNPALGG